MKHTPTNFGVPVHSNKLDHWLDAGFNWSVKAKKLRTMDGIKVPGKVALVNSDTNAVLGVVSDKYKVVQPAAMLETFQHAVTDLGFNMDRLGMYNGGQIIWGRADMHEGFDAKAGDKLGYYMYFATSMDGSLATMSMISAIRIVCLNSMAVAAKNAQIKMRVKHNTEYDPVQFRNQAQYFGEAKAGFEENVRVLNYKHFADREHFESIYQQVIEQKPRLDAKDELHHRWGTRMNKMLTATMTSPGSQYNPGSFWNILNGYTYLVDHESRARSEEAAHRNSVFGPGSKRKMQVMEELVTL